MLKVSLDASAYSKIFWLEYSRLPTERQAQYHIYSITHHDKSLNVARLKDALQAVVNNNYNLRTIFQENGGKLNQVVFKDLSMHLAITKAENEEIAKEFIQAQINEPFILEKGPLFRFALIENTYNSTYTLVLVCHHIIVDGLQYLKHAQEIEEAYKSPASVQKDDNNEIPNFTTYLEWEKQRYKETDIALALKTIEKFPHSISLPRFTDTDITSKLTIIKSFDIDGDLQTKIQKFTQENSCSVFNLLKALWGSLISKYANQQKLLISYPVSVKRKNFKNIKGALINTLIYAHDEKKSLLEALRDEKGSYTDRAKRKNFYLNILDLSLALKGNLYLPISIAYSSFLQNIALTPGSWPAGRDELHQIGSAELLMRYGELDDGQIVIQLVAIAEKYSEAFLAQLGQQFIHLLKQALNKPELPLCKVSCLDRNELEKILCTWNKTNNPIIGDKTFIDLFQDEAIKNPNAVALVHQGKELTYQELNEKSNQLARLLQNEYRNFVNQNLKEGTLIALFLERGPEMMLSILAILKSGAAYVPIDIQYPAERIKFILRDTGCKLILSQSHLQKQLEKICENCKTIFTDRESYLGLQKTNLPCLSSENLAYVIYTSGTTGNPKGVMVVHRSFVNFLSSMAIKLKHQSYNVLSFTRYVFDIFGLEYGLPLISGGKLVISALDESIKDLKLHRDINLIQQTPSFWDQLIEKILGVLPNKEVTFLVGGEPSSSELISRLCNASSLVFNVYGPTETTVWSGLQKFEGDNVKVIGRPLDNQKFYILNYALEPVPVGAIGELYIGGIGLAQGYLNQIQLTKERFIANPFANREDKVKGFTTIYRTGDLARWLPDGSVEYNGRNDEQIKLRGLRIELGEIESTLNSLQGIKQSAVVLKKKSNTEFLVAYFISDKSQTSDEIRTYLAKYLPDYMIPNLFVQLDHLPLTVNGKLDKKSLPDPEIYSDKQYIAPRDDLEAEICRIWQEVLDYPQVGIHDDFFSLGGNSILAMQLTYKISKLLKKSIPIHYIFEYKTIAALQEAIFSADKIFNIEQILSAKHPLSFAQERLFFIEKYENGTNAYNIPITLELADSININAFKESLQKIIERQEILKTIYKSTNGIYYQEVLPGHLTIQELVLEEREFRPTLRDLINRIFDLENEWPIKVTLFYVEKKKYALINIHHIAFDGWSIELFKKELQAYYQNYITNSPLNLPVLTIQYRDFANWERMYLQGKNLEAALTYWKRQLRGYENLSIPTDKVRSQAINYDGCNFYFKIEKKLGNKLKKLAKQQGVTLYTVLLSAFYILLARHSGQNDIVIGTPAANRHLHQVEDLYGFFVNNLVIRENLNWSLSIIDFVKQLQRTMIASLQHQELPFKLLVEALQVEKDPSRHPIFQVAFSVQSFENNSSCEDLFKVLPINEEYQVAKFDLSLIIDDSEEEFNAIFNYATTLFEKGTISRLTEHYLNVLDAIADNEASLLQDITLLSPNEYNQICYNWNQTQRSFPSIAQTVINVFEEQVEKTPFAPALLYKDQCLSYQELNIRANQLAHFLQKKFYKATGRVLSADTLIPISLSRGIEMIIAIVAILKAGAAYVPIDPNYPLERIKFILKDINSRILLTDKQAGGLLKELSTNSTIIYLDERPYIKEEKSNLSMPIAHKDLAYIIYTSGTTGEPNGVQVEHGGLINVSLNMVNSFGITLNSKVMQFSSIGFDAAVSEIFPSLLAGSQLVIASDEMRKSVELLTTAINQYEITIITLPPILAEQVSETSIKTLKTLVLAGDTIKQELMEKWGQKLKLINAYGPTEATICATMKVWSPGVSSKNIGKPNNNTQVYVLNSDLSITPVGVIGELYIGGMGLARGYLNKTLLTKERFIKNPFATSEDKAKGYTRLYKTGDLVKWLPTGELEYFGRNDFQVKVRGFRIELEEIESVLNSHPEVKQSAVLLKKRDQNKHLVAYYVSDNTFDQLVLENFLSARLPEFMIPKYYIRVESLPLNVNGKLDRRALPEPEFDNSATTYYPPTNEIEAKLCKLYQEVLGSKQVGIKDDFFKIGGDSILSMQLVSKIQEYGFVCSIKQLFECKTVENLAHALSSGTTVLEIETEQGILEGEFDLLPIQKWFFEKDLKNINYWNQSFLIKVPHLDLEKIKNALALLTNKHDALRLIFKKTKDGYRQLYKKQIDIPEVKVLDVSKISSLELAGNLTSWQSCFNIENGPLWQIAYIHGYDDGSARLYFAFHHLIIDTVSWRILLDDLRGMYEAKETSLKTSSYRQWVQAVAQYADKHPKEVKYWEDVLDEKKHICSPIQKKNEAYQDSLNHDLTRDLLQRVSIAYHTQINDLLLTALAYTIEEWTGKTENNILLEGHGREEIDAKVNLAHTVGWFTTIHPVKLKLQKNISETISATQKVLMKVPSKGIGFGALRYMCKDSVLKAYPLPQISFNYFGQVVNNPYDWAITDEFSGEAIAHENMDGGLSINCVIINGELKFRFSGCIESKELQKLGESFKKHLASIIEHCLMKITAPLPKDEVAGFLDSWRISNKVTGVVVSILNEDGRIEDYTSGTVAKGSNQSISPRNLFCIGSISKTFVAAAILQLHEEGKLKLDDTIGKYLKQYPRWNDITIFQLLSMTSGIYNYNETEFYKELLYSQSEEKISIETWLDLAYSQKEYFPAGQASRYANTNYLVLGLIIEAITKQSVAQNIENRFLIPLGLKNTHYVEAVFTDDVLNKLAFYDTEKNFYFNPSFFAYTGSIFISNHDFIKWVHAYVTPGIILNEKTIREMQDTLSFPLNLASQPPEAKYGLCIYSLKTKTSGKIYYYRGGIIGYGTAFVWVPDQEKVIIVQSTITPDGDYYIVSPDHTLIERLLKLG